ncbi:MAG: D-alanyl-D-alanine carboxypeptidase [Clostridiales bacterium]|nr:D-alanyl-D-alanine carboxypeptidase [Clostridiales bacterium]
MNRKWIRASLALIIAFCMIYMTIAAKGAPMIATNASAMAVIECETGQILACDNPDDRLPMASTTKIMTALVVLENCADSEIVEITKESVGIEGSSIYLSLGEKMTVKDLLYGLMLASGNDAAVALAVHVSGTVDGFVALMNKKAEEIGLKKTHFITPNGLHNDKHLTTAYELCLITREALKIPEFKEIVSTKYYTTSSGDKVRTFKNKNSLLWSYNGAFGVKTGYTSAAGRCLVFGAERDGMTVVGAVLNCRPMFETAAKLLDRAFSDYSVETIVPENTCVGKTFVENSPEKLLEVITKDSIITVMQKATESSFRTETEIFSPLTAPISKGETVGVLRVYSQDKLVGETDLIAGSDMKAIGFEYWWNALVRLFA